MKMEPIIETPRLRFRPPTLADVQALTTLWGDDQVQRYLGGVSSPEGAGAHVERILRHWNDHGYGMWVVHDAATAAIAGLCGLSHSEGEIELSYKFWPAFWGRGLATEAGWAVLRFGFETLALERIVGITQVGNLGSQRVLEKLGMRHQRNEVRWGDEQRIYALDRDGWLTVSATQLGDLEGAPHMLSPVHPGTAPRLAGLSLETPQRRTSAPAAESVALDDGLFYQAFQQGDGTYSVTLSEEGLEAFETSLAIARDLGGKTRISTYSTIQDIMERTATREELSQLLRSDGHGFLCRARTTVLTRKLRGSDEPSYGQRIIGHIGKALIVGAIAVWTLLQFATAVADIAAIPGILANIPNDLLNLHPTSAFSDVGGKISDAGRRALIGVLGVCLVYIVSKLIQPLGRIYRKDGVIPGERLALRTTASGLRKLHERSSKSPSEPSS